MENNSLQELENNLVGRLSEVKEIMNKQRDELSVSIRRDVVATELKSILLDNADFYSLKESLESYIKSLYDVIVQKEEGNENNK